MGIAKVNPTRMELTNLKKRLRTAVRGHKLLKDKQDELVKKFIDLVKQNKALRVEVESRLSGAFSSVVVAEAVMSAPALQTALLFPAQEVSVKTGKRNIMSVNAPLFELSRRSIGATLPYGLAQTSAELDFALRGMQSVFEKMIRLAEVEKTCQLLAQEIEKTRRRVNALEYVMIPGFEQQIKEITMKLDEADRSTRVNLMKVKQMVRQ